MKISTRPLRRLLVLLPATRFGGTERHTAQLSARLAVRAGLEVVLAAEPHLHAALAAALPPGLPPPAFAAAAIGWEQSAPPAENIARQEAATAALLAEHRPDIALVPLPWPNAGLGLLRALAQAGLPRLVVVHLAAGSPMPAGIAEALPGLDAAGAGWCAVSAPLARRAERFFGLAEGRVALVDNPAPPPRSSDSRAFARRTLRAGLGLGPDEPLLLFVGRLEHGKGADLLPALAARLDITLAVAGEGPLEAALLRQSGRLRLLGQLADPWPWYLGADAVLLPSRLEGVPLVFLEAAAAGCPVIATEAALEGLGEAAPRLACLAASADVEALAEATRGLLADADGRADMAARAQAEAARRGWDRIIEDWLGLLRAAGLLARATEIAA